MTKKRSLATPTDENQVELLLDLIRDTDAAWYVTDGNIFVWIPKSLVEQNGDDPRLFTLPEWLAIDRGLL